MSTHESETPFFRSRATIAMAAMLCLGQAIPVYAQQEDRDDIEEIIITGSRIEREAVSVTPVTSFGIDAIEVTGDSSMSQLLRDLPYNSQGSTLTPVVGFTTQLSSDVNMRNLGLGRTLSLANGRRLVTGALGFGFGQSLTFLPYRVTERVEVLRESASAIYGADAIGGVVNVVFRDTYEGTEIMAYGGRPDGGGDENVLSIMSGLVGDRSSLYVALERRENSELWKFERDYTASQYSDLGFGFSSVGNPPTYRVTDVAGDGSGVVGPSTPAPLCPPERIRQLDALNAECRWPVADKEQLIPENDATSIFLRGTYDVTDELELFAEVYYAQQESSGINASRVGIFGVPMAADNPNNPTANATPGNPIAGVTGPRPIVFDLRPADDFILQLDIESENTHAVIGGDWRGEPGTLSFYAQYSEQDTLSLYRNSVIRSDVYTAVANGVINPFADQDSQLAGWQSVGATGERDADSRLRVYSLSWSSDLPFWELPGGSIGYAAGYDYRKESLVENCDPFTRIFSLSGAFCFQRDEVQQEVNSMYGELIVPFTDKLELHYALRNDDYDLPDDSALTNSLSLRYDILENLSARASYSEGFRAPNLFQLSSSTTQSVQQVVDQVQCQEAGGDPNDPRCQGVSVVQTIKGGGDVGPEESETVMIGVAWQPAEWLALSLDWWDIEVDDQIANLNSGVVLNLEAQGFNLSDFGVAVERDANGDLVGVTSGTANVPGFSTSGIDIEASAVWETRSMGSFDSRLWLSHTMEFERSPFPGEPSVDAIDSLSEWKGTWSNSWFIGDWRANLSFNFNAGYDALSPEQKSSGDFGDVGEIDDFNTIDVSVTYMAPWNGDISLGARNVTDEDPPINRFRFGALGYSTAEHNALGRVVWLRYTQRFANGG